MKGLLQQMSRIFIDKIIMIKSSTIVSFIKVLITFFLLYVTKDFDYPFPPSVPIWHRLVKLLVLQPMIGCYRFWYLSVVFGTVAEMFSVLVCWFRYRQCDVSLYFSVIFGTFLLFSLFICCFQCCY